MTPIVSIAQTCDVSIIGLMHLSKDQDTLGRRLEGLARGIMKLFRPDPAQPDRRRLEVIGNFKEPPHLGVTLRDGGCDFDFNPPKDATRSIGGRPPEKTEKADQFPDGEARSKTTRGCELIDEWTASGEIGDDPSLMRGRNAGGTAARWFDDSGNRKFGTSSGLGLKPSRTKIQTVQDSPHFDKV